MTVKIQEEEEVQQQQEQQRRVHVLSGKLPEWKQIIMIVL